MPPAALFISYPNAAPVRRKSIIKDAIMRPVSVSSVDQHALQPQRTFAFCLCAFPQKKVH